LNIKFDVQISESPELRLVEVDAPRDPDETRRPGAVARVFLPPSLRLNEFTQMAAGRGLHPEEAVRLTLERHFALIDTRKLGVGAETACLLLSHRARTASPRRSLTDDEAVRLRALTLANPVAAPDCRDGLWVAIPGRQMTRFGERVTMRAFRARYVAEAIAWEAAAIMEGPTMGEWALHALAGAAIA